MKKLLLTTAALAVATAGLGTGGVHAYAAAAATKPAGITWGDCPAQPDTVPPRDPAETCGTLRVPLDYRHPGGRQITVAVSRIAASDPARRRGILLVNPGGPGQSGIDEPGTFADSADPAVRATYDIIGFDPRGVGLSTPVTCGLSEAEILPPDTYPAPDGSIAGNVASAKNVAQRCRASSGDLLPYMTTADTARDMDRIREALGESKTSYWGQSYGTYLGTVYASLYPGRVDRMILDSAVDPSEIWYEQLRTRASGVATRFPDAAAYAASQHVLGSTPAAVTKAYLALVAKLDREQVALPGAAVPLSGALMRFMTNGLLGSDAYFPYLTAAWTAADQLVDGRGGDDAVQVFRDLLPQISPVSGAYPGVPSDNGIAAAYAIACGDVRWSHDVGTYARNVAHDRVAYPLSAGSEANVWPCAFWTAPIESPATITNLGARDILILQNQRDPNTPIAGARALRKTLGGRAVMVSADAGGHGVYFNHVTCATTVGDAFLTRGALPKADTTCG